MENSRENISKIIQGDKDLFSEYISDNHEYLASLVYVYLKRYNFFNIQEISSEIYNDLIYKLYLKRELFFNILLEKPDKYESYLISTINNLIIDYIRNSKNPIKLVEYSEEIEYDKESREEHFFYDDTFELIKRLKFDYILKKNYDTYSDLGRIRDNIKFILTKLKEDDRVLLKTLGLLYIEMDRLDFKFIKTEYKSNFSDLQDRILVIKMKLIERHKKNQKQFTNLKNLWQKILNIETQEQMLLRRFHSIDKQDIYAKMEKLRQKKESLQRKFRKKYENFLDTKSVVITPVKDILYIYNLKTNDTNISLINTKKFRLREKIEKIFSIERSKTVNHLAEGI